MIDFDVSEMQDLVRSQENSHKGQNGRLLVIGGSKLFHASVFWSADVASKIVDLVHFSSPANENNEVIRKKLKEGFWNGIVVDYGEVEEYIKEDNCVLIGPGMPRDEGLSEGETSTGEIVNDLLSRYPEKRWVVDGGALQTVDAKHLNGNMIVTPHKKEWQILSGNSSDEASEDELAKFSREHDGVVIIYKGVEDVVCGEDMCVKVRGGNAGMTKGGTGDVLAGLVAALYCRNDAFLAAKAASYVNKMAGDRLYEKVGEYYNASDLVGEVPKSLNDLLQG